MGGNKVRPVIFLVTDKQFRDIQEAVEQFDLSRSEILRRALRVGLPILLHGAPTQLSGSQGLHG